MELIVTIVLILGVNTALWASFGIARAAAERSPSHRPAEPYDHPPLSRVAVVIAARNEQPVIADTIRSVKAQIPGRQIFVVSDGSTDATAAIARAEGANVVELFPNRGKAAAIVAGLRHFGIVNRFDVVTLLDADTLLTPDYFESGLSQFDQPDVVAVAGRAQTRDDSPPASLGGRILIAYRERVYIAVQYLQKFGQAARRVNVVSIVPGFASMYRTEVIADIDIAAEGLAIEDYNMTFEVHAKALGRIAFHPLKSIAVTQDPDNFHDYTRQVRRWSLGFWQTVRRHRFRLSGFWLALSLFIAELLVSSVLLLLIIGLLGISLGAGVAIAFGAEPEGPAGDILTVFPPLVLIMVIVVPDLVLTVFAAIVARRPRYLCYALVFPMLRIVDAILCLLALLDASLKRSNGVWQSPRRRTTAQEPAEGGADVDPAPTPADARREPVSVPPRSASRPDESVFSH